MAITESFFDTFMPLIVSLALAVLSLSLAHYWLLAREPNLGSEARLPRQIIMLVCTVAAIILAVIVAPLTEGTRNQILSIIGLGISAVIAFSSTSFVTNFMAAITLRVTKPFNIGDFVTVGDCFGTWTVRYRNSDREPRTRIYSEQSVYSDPRQSHPSLGCDYFQHLVAGL